MLVEPAEALVPEASVRLHPVRDLAQGSRLEPAEAPLRVRALRDQARPLENLEVLRDGRLRHLERLGQLPHGRLAVGQAGQDGAPGGVGESREDAAQAIKLEAWMGDP